MIAIGVFLAWAAFGLGVWGVALIKGWNLGFVDIWSPAGYYRGKWPPALAGNTVIIPDGSKASLASASFEDGGASSSGTSSGSSGGSAPAQPSGTLTQPATIQKAAATFGWGSGQQFACLTNLLIRESGGGNPNDVNSSSGAYGAAQSLTHGGCGGASCGHDEYCGYGLSVAQTKQANCGNLWYQILWMLGYIKARYGTPCKAWAQYCNHPDGKCWY